MKSNYKIKLLQNSIGKYSYAIFILLLFFISCDQEKGYELELPSHFPTPNIPADNSLTINRINLGKKLFFDPMLSKDTTVSCASCHFPTQAFSDTLPLSRGIHRNLGKRNAPSLLNVAFVPQLFRDGGVPNLEIQVISPLENPNEMGFKLRDAAERLSENDLYQKMSKSAYQREFSPYVLVRALAAYQRTLIGGNSRYDLFQFQNQKDQLSEGEQRGRQLFFNQKTNCSSCHEGVLFTNFAFENNGLHETYKDVGRAGVTMKQLDKFKFRVPSLRNVELTAPYMHDGSLANLEAVIEHYNQGGKQHLQQNPLIRPLYLTEREKADLVAFLKSLTHQN